jgi:hypothetical protein
MMKISSALLGVIGLGLMAAAAMAQTTPTIGGPNSQGSSPYVGQQVGGSGGPTGSSIGTPGGSGQGPMISNPHFGGSTAVGGAAAKV